MSNIRVRFAPSPTGFLHVGGLRTALYNFLFAAHNGGKILLRIEDTDQSRKVAGAVENLLKSLEWAGIHFDEGFASGGDSGPYRQSERLEIYLSHLKILLENNDAYPCFCTEEDLKLMREDQIKRKQPTRYDGRCRRLELDERNKKLAQKIPHVIRLKIIHSRGSYRIKDLIRGRVEFKPSQIDDQILLKSDGFPTYHLASVVDDHLMGITHVIRGEEWLPSTPKHIQLYQYFGWELPEFAHLPLLLNPDRSKLSKRQGDVATEDFRDKGFLPETLVNFVALCGWNTSDTQEIFTLDDLSQKFTLDRVGKAGAIFDTGKLRWMNQQYLKQKSLPQLLELLKPYLPPLAQDQDPETLNKMIQAVRDSLVLLPDIKDKLEIFFTDKPVLKPELREKVNAPSTKTIFQAFISKVQDQEEITTDNFGKIMKSIQKETGIKGKNLWIPMRIAITLAEQGPELPLVAEILGKIKCLKRINSLLQDLESLQPRSGGE